MNISVPGHQLQKDRCPPHRPLTNKICLKNRVHYLEYQKDRAGNGNYPESSPVKLFNLYFMDPDFNRTRMKV